MSRFKYSVGPWNVHEGADAYGPATRDTIPFEEKIKVFKEIGFDAIQFHDDDAVPNMNDLSEEEIIVEAKKVKALLDKYDLKAEFVAPRLWMDPRTIDGGFTSNSKEDRDFAIWRAYRSIDIAKALGCDKIVLWLAREGTICYEDMPRQYDNWEISNYYVDKKYVLDKVESIKQIEKDGGFGFEITRKYNESVIRQYVLLYPESRRIDIKNDIDWHENQVLLKAEFDVDIHSTRASYDVQFGNTERNTHQNTSWDAAKFEVCAQKWADLSEDDYGVSILNDCKYGHSIIGDHMTITMLKCGINPSTVDDHGQHLFTYSILPHTGDFKKGGTINEAILLNRPLVAFDSLGGGKLPESYSLVTCDKENIIVETVKQAENGDGIVVRLHDEWNRKASVTLKFGFDAKKVYITDMLENVIEEVPVTENTVKLNVSNFEIVTLLIR